MPATVRFRPDRGAWFIFYRVGKKRWSRRIEQGEEAARAHADVFNASLDERREREAMLYPGGPAPFDVIAAAWWQTKEPGLPASSRVSKRCVVFDRLIPYWGDRDVRRIDEDDARACAVHWVEKRDHARETIETTGSMLDSILVWGVRRGYAEGCPVLRRCGGRGVRSIFREVAAARARPRARIEAWSREEARALTEAAAARGAWLGDPVLFASQTGCRRGEILALEWGDVDLTLGLATIRQSSSRGQNKTTKADKKRTLALSPAALEMLQRRGARGRSGRVFRDPAGKPWVDYTFHGYWVRARRAAKTARPLKFHCWRHTWATWALAAGHDPGWCAGQIGDTLDIFMRRYAHAMPGVARSLDFLDLTPPHGADPRPESGAAPPALALPRGAARARRPPRERTGSTKPG